MQQRLLLAQADLPTDMPAPTVGTFDPAQATVVTLGVSSRTLAPGTLSAIVTNNIVPDLEQIDGVSNVNVGGSLTPAIEVQVNPRRLSAAGFTLNDIVSSISSNNNREPGGIAYLPNRETTIDVRGDVTNVASVADLPIQAASQYTTTFGNASYSVPAIPGAPGAPCKRLGRGNERGRDRCSAPNAGSGRNGERGPELGARDRIACSRRARRPPRPHRTFRSLPLQRSSPRRRLCQPPCNRASLRTIVAQASPGAAAPAAAAPAVAAATGGSYGGPSLSTLNQWSASPHQMRIADVATVTDSFEPQRQYSYVGGSPTISLGVQKSTNASEVTAAQNVMKALPAIESSYPALDFQVLNNQAAYTKQQIWSVFHTLIEAILITAVVMLFFLRSWRNSIVVLIAIPASLCVTLTAMRIVNFTIDTVSLLAMTLIIGILVDDSIVVLENIERHYENGDVPWDAAIKGRTQIGPAAIVITLVDVVVFLPIAFLPGTVGRFLSEFALVVVVATLTSLCVSFTITPSLAGKLVAALGLESAQADRKLRARLRTPAPVVCAARPAVGAAPAAAGLWRLGRRGCGLDTAYSSRSGWIRVHPAGRSR